MPNDDFLAEIKKFNDMYKLSSNDKPSLQGKLRVENFIDILSEEVEEGKDIVKKLSELENTEVSAPEFSRKKLEALTDLSDWLGDLIVYCASEARRWGLPLNEVLNIIMSSNFSKLDTDGKPIYDSRGKVEKGPNYWKPEPKISNLLNSIIDPK